MSYCRGRVYWEPETWYSGFTSSLILIPYDVIGAHIVKNTSGIICGLQNETSLRDTVTENIAYIIAATTAADLGQRQHDHVSPAHLTFGGKQWQMKQ